MRKFFFAALALMLVAVLSFAVAPSAQANGCEIQQIGESHNFTVVCPNLPQGQVDLDVIGDTIVVEKIVKVPGPVKTIVKRVVQRVPGPTKTVTATPRPRVIERTVSPSPQIVERLVSGPVVTKTPEALPQATVTQYVTETVTPRPAKTRQDRSVDDTMMPERNPADFFSPHIDFGDGRTTVAEVGIGFLTLVALVGLLLIAMYAGYVVGYRENEHAETNFMRAVLEAAALRRGKHS